MVTDLMPASSPGRRSSTSALKPARSAQRRYMRMRFWAQSCDSVPPAPGWIERMAFFLSWGPDRTILMEKLSRSCMREASPFSISGASLSSPASVAISQRTRRSSACWASSLKRPTVRATSARSWTRICALRLSSQKVGADISWSIRASRVSLARRSKMPPEVLELLLRVGEIALEVSEHDLGRSPTESRPRRRPRDGEAEVGQPVPPARVERGPAPKSHARREVTALEEGQHRPHHTRWAHERRDSRVRCAGDGDPVLHRAKGQRAQVLPGPARTPEPRIVGDVRHEARAPDHETPEQLGEDDLVTDHGAEWRPGQRENRLAGPGREVRDELGPAPDEAYEAGERDVLAERHEVNLIILGRNPLFSQQKSAVQELTAWSRQPVDRAHQDGHSELGGKAGQPREQDGIAAQENGCCRLGPQDDPRFRARGLARELLVAGEGLGLMGGIPLEGLLDRGLDDGHLDGRGGTTRRRAVFVSEHPPAECERSRRENGGRGGPGRRPPNSQHAPGRQGGVDGDDDQGDRIDAAELGDLDDRERPVLRIAE